MALRAVVFDYGMVLTGTPNLEARAELLRLTGLPVNRFEPLYWADRNAYDLGLLTGPAFWRKFALKADLPRDPAFIEELNLWDARYWTSQNSAMLDWQLQLKQRGLLTAILSNMGDNVLANIEREFDWLHRFDVLVWSFQLRLAKPDPAIYRHTLEKLGVEPHETFFIDDNHANIEAARALGIRAVQFTSMDGLRRDMLAAGLDKELPMPA